MAPAGTNEAARKGITLFSALRTLLAALAVSYFAFWACCASDACATGADCDTGYCYGASATSAGTCCATACTGSCESCSTGTCLPTHTSVACLSDGTACAGICDGVHSDCAYPDSTVQCRAPSCDSATSTATLSAFCNGAGACPAAQTQACAPAACEATQCAGCVGGSDCNANEHCAGGVCVANLSIGASCAGSTECASGFCVDGVCCGSACSSQCQACNGTGNEGICIPISGPPHGGRPQCAGAGGPCEGQCDGTMTDACAYPAGETLCSNEGVCGGGGLSCACKTGVMDVCDGQGSCYAPPAIRCACPDAGIPADAGLPKEAGTDAAISLDAGADAKMTSAEAGTGPTGGTIEGGGCDCRAAGPGPRGDTWLVGMAAGAAWLSGSRRGRRRAMRGTVPRERRGNP